MNTGMISESSPPVLSRGSAANSYRYGEALCSGSTREPGAGLCEFFVERYP